MERNFGDWVPFADSIEICTQVQVMLVEFSKILYCTFSPGKFLSNNKHKGSLSGHYNNMNKYGLFITQHMF